MSIEKFQTIESTAVPLPIENVDTDQIIPARFLKATTRDGFGENLFRDWRYDRHGEPIRDFVMNRETTVISVSACCIFQFSLAKSSSVKSYPLLWYS